MAKQPKQTKTDDARRREAELIRAKLRDELGITEDALVQVLRALDEFADKGWGCTQTFKVPEYGIVVLLQLSTQPHISSFARVRRAP